MTRYHVDMLVEDRVGVLAEISNAFSKHNVSLKTVRQENKDDEGARLVVVTHSATEKDLEETVDTLNELDAVREVHSVIRMEGK